MERTKGCRVEVFRSPVTQAWPRRCQQEQDGDLEHEVKAMSDSAGCLCQEP